MAEDKSSINLAGICQEAFTAYPNSCSHSVWYVISRYEPSQPYMMANALIDYLSGSSQWHEVQLSEVAEAARMGKLVVGGLKGKEHGHVVVVYPGQEKPRGGYFYTPKRTGTLTKLATKGMYPLAMSTSMGTFPGAKSNGDKTVWDPWGSDISFQQVRFWEYKGAPKQLPRLTSARWKGKPVLLSKKRHSKSAPTASVRWEIGTSNNPLWGRLKKFARWIR